MCAGVREDWTNIESNDPDWQNLSAIAQESARRPEAWLEQRHIYDTLSDDPIFAPAFCRWLQVIWSKGSLAALEAYIGQAQNVKSETSG